jgi:hypothetical protein
MLFYNGNKFQEFRSLFLSLQPRLSKCIELIDQPEQIKSGKIENRYHFYPYGVWWKWVPFRYDISKHEISIDTDIFCINEPVDMAQWQFSSREIILALDRLEKVSKGSCGDFGSHPFLQGKDPYNCGVVGMQAGYDYSDRFFEITDQIRYGETHDSMFITEQGAINLWSYSLDAEGVKTYALDYKKNAWFRDFVYFLTRGVKVETVHATAWHKQIAAQMKDIMERKALSDDYPDQDFVRDVMARSKKLGAQAESVLSRQLSDSEIYRETYFVSPV